MLHVHTNEVMAELVGHPVDVTVDLERPADPASVAAPAGVSCVHIVGTERDDSAVGGTLLLRGENPKLREIAQRILDEVPAE